MLVLLYNVTTIRNKQNSLNIVPSFLQGEENKNCLFYKKKNVDKEYLKMFWVGLMDGDGSIQVNHSRNKNLQYRLVIKLLNLESNYIMLIKIAKVIGGAVRTVGNDVIWVVNDKKIIVNIRKI